MIILSFIVAGVCFVITVVCFRRAKQGMIWITLSVIFVLLAMSQLYTAQAQRKALEQGEYWLSHCQLRVANINNGVFQDRTNQLDCEGVITYVSTQDYTEALDAVKKQQNDKVRENNSWKVNFRE
ncbi:hypothetical protein A3Q29_21220 [Providencia stuartii]|uniref:Uncharacterized protein n=1 Tax=Providencia stuartii TaxID=588 RepID=A0A1S1HL98_PROST|nr:hypothetical protein A3Q29_21220 [Providencia stuartii]